MYEEMLFENPGPKIKKMATILFWVETVSCVILAFVFGWDRGYRHTEFLPGIFFGFLIGGPLVSYCSALLLHGFGELVEKVEAMQNCCKAFEKKSSMTVPATRKPEKDVCAVTKPQEKDVQPATKPEILVEAEALRCDDPNCIKCPSCGLVQNSKRNVCWGCGLKFIQDTKTM